MVRLTDKVDDTRFQDVEEVLRRVTDMTLNKKYRRGDDVFTPTGIVVILVDKTKGERDNYYNIKCELSSMRTHEAIALLECAKHQALGYLEKSLGKW